jgi:hypothetical protein
MSLRDFNSPANDRPVALNHEPNGNGTGLGEFHTVHPEETEPNNTGKIVGALAVALMVGAAGIYAYTISGHAANPAPMQQTASLPKAPPPVAPPAMTAPAPDSTVPDAAAPVSTPEPAPQPAMKAAETKPVEKPVKSAATKQAPASMSDGASVRMKADSQGTSTSQQAAATAVAPAAPQQQAAAAPVTPEQQPVPEPVSPAPNPSDLANANPQSSVSVPQGATTAQDMPAQALTPEQPAQQPEAASPATDQPAQSAGQVAQ